MSDFCTVEQFKLLKETLQGKKTQQVTVVSNSMEPLIQTGEPILVRPLIGLPQKFDVLVFWQNGHFICHFVWLVNKFSWRGESTQIVTRSLSQPYEDLPFPQEHIFGIVIDKRLSFFTKLKLLFT